MYLLSRYLICCFIYLGLTSEKPLWPMLIPPHSESKIFLNIYSISHSNIILCTLYKNFVLYICAFLSVCGNRLNGIELNVDSQLVEGVAVGLQTVAGSMRVVHVSHSDLHMPCRQQNSIGRNGYRILCRTIVTGEINKGNENKYHRWDDKTLFLKTKQKLRSAQKKHYYRILPVVQALYFAWKQLRYIRRLISDEGRLVLMP